jgi:protein TonB
MNMKSAVIAVALVGGLLSTTALATTAAAHHQTSAVIGLELPTVAKVVSPTDLPGSARGATVTLQFTIDAEGLPHDIRIVSPGDQALAKNLIPAVSQWQFTPARKNGVPVATKVELPLELKES